MAPISISARISEGDAWRRSPAPSSGPPRHREWSHFHVCDAALDLIVNLSLADATHGEGFRLEVPRAVVLARGPDGAWEGDVDAYARHDTAVGAGSIDLRMGPNALRFRDEVYALELRLARRELAAHLRLRPIARPAHTRSIGLGAQDAMRRFIVPRLEASGEVVLRGRRIELDAAPAFHAHEWGSFRWGGDFSWESAVAFGPGSRSPWTLVFRRISDRARLRTRWQEVGLWRGDLHVRALREADVSVQSAGRLRAQRALRVPRVMRLAAPGTAADLPRRLEVRAGQGRDAVEATFELLDLAQVAIPNDDDAGATLLSEVRARAWVAGCVRGEALRFEAPALVELSRGAA